MSSKVVCPSCGKKYKWDDRFAGRKIKCACGEVFRMEAGAAATPPAPKPKSPPPPPAPKPPAPESGPLELADEPPPPPPPTAGKTPSQCPKCQSDLAPGAVLCVECGYHLKTGHSLRTSTAADIDDLKQRDQEELERQHRFQEWIAPSIVLGVGLVLMVVTAFVVMGKVEKLMAEEAAALAKAQAEWASVYGGDVGGDDNAVIDDDTASEGAVEQGVADSGAAEEPVAGQGDDPGVAEDTSPDHGDTYDPQARSENAGPADDTQLTAAGKAVGVVVILLLMAAMTFVTFIGFVIVCAITVRLLGASFGNLLTALLKLGAMCASSVSVQLLLTAWMGTEYFGFMGAVAIYLVVLTWLFELDGTEASIVVGINIPFMWVISFVFIGLIFGGVL